jgi:predicted nuclease of predicted toxin-antitoxin system
VNIKLDENIPASLAAPLTELGHNVDTVPQERLAGSDDKTIWAAAQQEKRFLITQDLDFSDIRRFRPGDHHGILLVRLRNPGRLALAKQIREVFSKENITLIE